MENWSRSAGTGNIQIHHLYAPKARLTHGIAVDILCIQHGWWQSCPELDLPGYDPYSSEGANANLLYSTKYIDKISGSVPYKAYLCKVCKIAK